MFRWDLIYNIVTLIMKIYYLFQDRTSYEIVTWNTFQTYLLECAFILWLTWILFSGDSFWSRSTKSRVTGLDVFKLVSLKMNCNIPWAFKNCVTYIIFSFYFCRIIVSLTAVTPSTHTNLLVVKISHIYINIIDLFLFDRWHRLTWIKNDCYINWMCPKAIYWLNYMLIVWIKGKLKTNFNFVLDLVFIFVDQCLILLVSCNAGHWTTFLFLWKNKVTSYERHGR